MTRPVHVQPNLHTRPSAVKPTKNLLQLLLCGCGRLEAVQLKHLEIKSNKTRLARLIRIFSCTNKCMFGNNNNDNTNIFRVQPSPVYFPFCNCRVWFATGLTSSVSSMSSRSVSVMLRILSPASI